jgi:RNA polymerase sigma-70 factor (ECF subfamily)
MMKLFETTAKAGRETSLESLDTNSLLEKVAEGNKAAFSALYSKTSGKVHGLVVKILRDPAQSEEVTQEIFLEVWQIAAQYTPSKGSAVSWLMTIAHRRTVDRIRASEASRQRDTKIGIRDYVSTYDNVVDTVDMHVEHEKVQKAMNRLTDLQKQTVVLAYYGGYSYKEIAENLSVPVGTVKTRLRDGMIRLRDELGVVA